MAGPVEPDRPDLVEYFADLPATMQEQLVRISRCTLGMSSSEKALARITLASVGNTLADLAETDEDDVVATAELLTALATIVWRAEGQALSGSLGRTD